MKRGFFPQEGMHVLDHVDSFSFLEVRKAATAPGIFRKLNQMMLFETIFNRLHVLFCLVFLGGGGRGCHYKAPKWRVRD